MQISAKNQIKGKVTSVIHGTSYSQVAVEQTDADGNTMVVLLCSNTCRYCKKMELTGGNIVTCIFQQQLSFLPNMIKKIRWKLSSRPLS